MIRARCIRACTWLGRYWAVGAVYEGTETPPSHFVILENSTTPDPDPDPKPDTPGGESGCDCDCKNNRATDAEVNEMLDEIFPSSGN